MSQSAIEQVRPRGILGRAIDRVKSSAFFERYRVAVIVEPRLSRPLWTWESWSLIMPPLSALIEGLSAEAMIRPRQAGNDDKWLPFGRLPWNETNNRTWTTKYLTDPAMTEQARFAATEIWAPSRSRSFDTWRGPELFALLDHSEIGNQQGFVLAVRKDVLPRVGKAADATLQALTRFFVEPRHAVFDRRWGEHGRFGSIIIVNGLDWTRADAVMDWADAHPLRHVPGFAWRESDAV